jgi:hypothetical protein
MSDGDREVLTPRSRGGIPAAERQRLDMEKLWPQAEFKRFLFTLLDGALIHTGITGTDPRHFIFGEGRRSLGYDILRLVEKIDPNAHALILTEGHKSQLEAPRAKPYDRLSELDERRGARNPGEQPQFLDYSTDPE